MCETSIVIPVYNAEEYLKECIDSVVSLSSSDLELILVDDGSTDSSGDICDVYAKKDSRVKVIHQENSGVSAARNTGIEIASGKYVVFIDSDDYIKADYLSELHKAISSNPYSWCFCGFQEMEEKGAVLWDCLYQTDKEYDVFPISEYGTVLHKKFASMLWNRIYELDIIKLYNIRFDETFSRSEDVLFNLEYGKYCKSFSVINKPLYVHRLYLENEKEHLGSQQVDNLFSLNCKIYNARKQLTKEEDIRGLKTDFFHLFVKDLIALFHNEKLKEKEKKNEFKEMINSDSFVEVFQGADLSNENKKFIAALKLKSYNLVKRILR